MPRLTLVQYSNLSPGAWFRTQNRNGSYVIHCRSSTDRTLTFDLGGNFKTDTYSFRPTDMVEPVNVGVKLYDE